MPKYGEEKKCMIEPFRLWLGISRRELDSNDERVWFLFDFNFHLNNLWYSVFGKLFRKFAHCWIEYAFLGLKRICLYFLNFLNGYQLWSTPKAEFNDAFLNRHKDSFVIFFLIFRMKQKFTMISTLLFFLLWTAQYLNYKPTDRLLLAHLTRYIDI